MQKRPAGNDVFPRRFAPDRAKRKYILLILLA